MYGIKTTIDKIEVRFELNDGYAFNTMEEAKSVIEDMDEFCDFGPYKEGEYFVATFWVGENGGLWSTVCDAEELISEFVKEV